jgi:hypothetical protein
MIARVSGDDYRPREHDHLVEPMFGGLGVEGGPRTDEPLELPRGFLRFWRRLWRALVRLVRPSRPASGR